MNIFQVALSAVLALAIACDVVQQMLIKSQRELIETFKAQHAADQRLIAFQRYYASHPVERQGE